MIGGMSWESTIPYYRILNETIREELGGLHSARLVLDSVDFAEIEELQRAGQWGEAGRVLADTAQRLERAGAEMLILCTNTMHIVSDAITASVSIPFLHIADATADAIRAAGLTTIGLLGTRFTMEKDFYRERLEQQGLRVLIPDPAAREMVHRVIFDELCLGRVEDASRRAYVEVIEQLIAAGAEGVILGCTEIGMLIKPEHVRVPVFDTTELHARAAARMALGFGVRQR